MPYFFIIPAYLILLLVLGIAAVVLRGGGDGGRASVSIVSGMAGTLPGIVVANVAVTVAGVAPLWLSGQVSAPEWMRQVLSVFAVVCLFIGPFVASALGVIAGFLGGWWLVRRGGK